MTNSNHKEMFIYSRYFCMCLVVFFSQKQNLIVRLIQERAMESCNGWRFLCPVFNTWWVWRCVTFRQPLFTEWIRSFRTESRTCLCNSICQHKWFSKFRRSSASGCRSKYMSDLKLCISLDRSPFIFGEKEWNSFTLKSAQRNII